MIDGPSSPQGVPGDFAVTSLLSDLNGAGPDDVMPIVLSGLELEMGAVAVRLLFADVEERLLTVWGQAGTHATEPSPRVMIDGSAQGQVYLTGRTMGGEIDLEPAIIAPVIARAERLGVLEVRLGTPPLPRHEAVADAIGLLLGYITVAADRWTDEFHVARRRQNMDLAAEAQWDSLPLAAFSTSRVALAGALEPAYEIAGDLFDYACGRAHLAACILDGMGHGVTSARLSDLALVAYRNARRSGKDLGAQASFVHETLARGFDREGFVTGQMLWVDLGRPGQSLIVNAGHPPPYLHRGHDDPVTLELHINYPFGMPFENRLRTQELELRSGDRLVLYSDGVIEARPDGGEVFGEERLAEEMVAVRDFPPREAARRIISAVRRHRAADLTDDATLLMVDIQ
jgi:hypothetical protein